MISYVSITSLVAGAPAVTQRLVWPPRLPDTSVVVRFPGSTLHSLWFGFAELVAPEVRLSG